MNLEAHNIMIIISFFQICRILQAQETQLSSQLQAPST